MSGAATQGSVGNQPLRAIVGQGNGFDGRLAKYLLQHQEDLILNNMRAIEAAGAQRKFLTIRRKIFLDKI